MKTRQEIHFFGIELIFNTNKTDDWSFQIPGIHESNGKFNSKYFRFDFKTWDFEKFRSETTSDVNNFGKPLLAIYQNRGF